MSITTFDDHAVAALLQDFDDHLVCWEVRRVIGSLIYIEMGRHWPYKLKTRDEEISIGSTSLSLEADNWIMRRGNQPVADAASLSDEQLPRISALLLGQRLKSIKFSRQNKKCRIVFTNNLHVTLRSGPDDEDLCVLSLPDGTLIGCGAADGFQSDGSTSEERAAAFALETAV